MQVRVLVPWPLTVAGAEHVSPAGADTWKLTAPLKPPTAETVIVDVPLAPARIVDGETDPAATEKSGAAATLYVITAVVCESVPLLPVTVTSNEPVEDAVHARVVCVSAGRVIERSGLQAKPRAGGIAVKDTVPVKPFRDKIVIVVEQAFPVTHGTEVGVDGEMSKSGAGTVTAIVTCWVNDPLVPVTFTRYVPGAMLGDAARLSWDVPEPPGMLVGFGVPVMPAGRETDSETVSVNPLIGVTAIAEV